MRCLVKRPTVASVTLLVDLSLAAGGCGSNNSSTAGCSSNRAVAGKASPASSSPNPVVAAGWTPPGGNLANTRDVASAISSSNASKLGVAWCVPIEANASSTITDNYATTPVVVNGVVYTQDLQSNVMAIRLATGKVLWTHTYNSLNGGPDGVNVVNGTVYVSAVPVNPNKGEYLGGAKGTLWALNARTGAPQWSWDEVQNLWGNPAINSGGGQWDPPSFDSQGNIYIGVGEPRPDRPDRVALRLSLGTSRPGPNLYTDSVVKLSPRGKLLWYYQLTPHDLYDWDLQDSPVLTTANGQPVVIDGGKAGILIELSAQTGKLLWKLPVGVHSGHHNDGLLTEYATPTSPSPLPAVFNLEPGLFGGIESQLATNGSTTFAAVNNLAVPMSEKGVAESSSAFEAAISQATGEMVAVGQNTGKIEWDDKLPSSPYGAAAVTNNVVFTTTYNGDLYAFNAATGAILLKRRCQPRQTRPSPSTATTSSPEQASHYPRRSDRSSSPADSEPTASSLTPSARG